MLYLMGDISCKLLLEGLHRSMFPIVWLLLTAGDRRACRGLGYERAQRRLRRRVHEAES